MERNKKLVEELFNNICSSETRVVNADFYVICENRKFKKPILRCITDKYSGIIIDCEVEVIAEDKM